jgi:hypothetical protein
METIRSSMRHALLAWVLVALPVTAFAETFFYIDPDWTGTQTGEAATPWTNMSTPAWSAVNSALASGPVTVYFSARNAGSDTDETSTVGLPLNRTDGSSNRLTLDGMTKFNTNDAVPSWTDYSGNSRFKITASYPVNSNNFSPPYPDRNFMTIRGFRIVATNGQIAALMGMSNLIFEFNDCYSLAGTTGGPAVITGIPFGTNMGIYGGSWSSHVTIRNNTIHDTFGEGIYIGGSTPDPAGAGDVQTGDDILVKDNIITNPGWHGGQGEGIDVKDGNTNLRIVGNTISWTTGYPSPLDYQAIVVEGADLIEGNFVYSNGAPFRNGIVTASAWNNSHGRNQLVIRNNIIAGATNNGMKLYGGASAPYQWSNTKIYNNAVYGSGDQSILITDTLHNGITLINNILSTSGEWNLYAPLGVFLAHSNNIYYAGPFGLVHSGSTTYDSSSLASFEPSAISLDPKFVSTGTPYASANFKLQSASPAIDKGATVTSFNYDFSGVTRPQGSAWDIGAHEFTSSNGTTPGVLTLSSTFECISVRENFTGDPNANNSAKIQFRKSGDALWKDAYAPIIDRRASISSHANPYVNQVRGSIVGLQPGTAYEVAVTFVDPDGISGSATLTSTVSTIAPAVPLSGNILYVDDVATNGNGSSASPFNSINNALNAATAGTTIMVRPGSYPPFTISKSGTASGYIAIVGGDRDQVFINADSNISIGVNGDFIQLKNLRLKKPGHYGISVNGHHHVWIENIYLEDLSVSMSYGDAGISMDNANDVYVLNSQILSPSMTAMPAASPRYDGPGEGIHIGAGVRNIIIKGNNIDGGFRDGIGNSPEGWGGGAIDNSDIAYNTVLNAKDDSIQIEGEDTNLRVYGNDVSSNDGLACLAMSPHLVGPVYVFRNVFKITAPYGGMVLKLYGSAAHTFYFHNTMDVAAGNDGWSGTGVNEVYHNNIISTVKTVPVYTWSGSTKFNANLYYRGNGGEIFSNPSYATVSAFRIGTGQEQQGKQGDPRYIDSAKRIDNTSPAHDAGIILANFNDAYSAWPYSGVAPDMGAYEFVSVPTADSDGDGLVDTWEIQYFGSISDPRAIWNADPDGDGFDNLTEQSAGTSPTNSASRLAITAQGFQSPSSFQIQWKSVSNQTYEVQSSTNMSGWSLATSITATSTNTTWTDSSVAGSGKKFYRIRVP